MVLIAFGMVIFTVVPKRLWKNHNECMGCESHQQVCLLVFQV